MLAAGRDLAARFRLPACLGDGARKRVSAGTGGDGASGEFFFFLARQRRRGTARSARLGWSGVAASQRGPPGLLWVPRRGKKEGLEGRLGASVRPRFF